MVNGIIKKRTWCDRDEHSLYEHFSDFNEWLDSDEGVALCEENGISGLSNRSKAFYAGDKEAYNQAFKKFCKERRHEVLCESCFCEICSDNHWFRRNMDHFDQLVECLKHGTVVPFIGAGLSVAGGFPTWKKHLRQQGRTAGIKSDDIENLLINGQYEPIIQLIEEVRGPDVFIQELRDVFSRTGELTDITLLITELFFDTVITTNYDRLIEQAYSTGQDNKLQIINGMDALEEPYPDKTTIIKLHGDIQNPARCILSKNQYDQNYGNPKLDLNLPIPKLLSYYYRNSSLLFLGCSLNKDRTMQVFQAVKDEIGDAYKPQHFTIEQVPEEESIIIERNAELARLGITAIWFEKDQFDYVEAILRHAKNELRHSGIIR